MRAARPGRGRRNADAAGMSRYCREPACRRSYSPVRGCRGAAKLGTGACPGAYPASPDAPKPNTVPSASPNVAMHGVPHEFGSSAGFRGARAALGQTATRNSLAIAVRARFRESDRSVIGRNAGGVGRDGDSAGNFVETTSNVTGREQQTPCGNRKDEPAGMNAACGRVTLPRAG